MKLGEMIAGFAVFFAGLNAEMKAVHELNDLEWSHRVLVAQCDNQEELSAFERQLDQFSAEVLDRKLVVFIVFEDSLHTRNLPTPTEQPERINQQIQQRLASHDVALIGLDGGTKARFDWDGFQMESVFALIDRMPMRRAELRERGD